MRGNGEANTRLQIVSGECINFYVLINIKTAVYRYLRASACSLDADGSRGVHKETSDDSGDVRQ